MFEKKDFFGEVAEKEPSELLTVEEVDKEIKLLEDQITLDEQLDPDQLTPEEGTDEGITKANRKMRLEQLKARRRELSERTPEEMA